MFKKISRLYHTVKYLKLKQIAWRAINFFPRFIRPVGNCPNSIGKHSINDFIVRKGITKDYQNFMFLSESHDLHEVGWDNASISKLWRYNLHYFEFLLQEDENDHELLKKKTLIDKWINENPFGKGTAWEPYPTSLRIVNWIKWHIKTDGLNEIAKSSLWNQVRWLFGRPEYHLLGNHLFINAKALLFASAFFNLNSNSKYFKLANNILIRELDEQFFEDGAHFELSPMYHSLAMEDLLDMINISDSLTSCFPQNIVKEKYLKGIGWLESMTYNNGELAHFNDCANGIAPSIKSLQNYAQRLGLRSSKQHSNSLKYYQDSGFVVYKDSKFHLIADIGKVGPDYLPGHAHADTLSFELAIKDQRVFVNSGTSVYGFSTERIRQRSTQAHSTIQIDGEDSSEVWSGFRVAKRARPFNIQIKLPIDDSNLVNFSASHDGFKRLKKPSIHNRVWSLDEKNWSIVDEISGEKNPVISRYYIHPDIHLKKTSTGFTILKNNQPLAECSFIHAKEVKVVDSTYHDEFGLSKPNKCIELTSESPCCLGIKIKLMENE